MDQQTRVRRTLNEILAPLVVLAALGFLVYGGGLSAPFIHDDYDSIVNNPEIERLWPPAEAFAAPPMSSVTGRPMVALTLAINYALGGREVFGYHLFNLALHILNAFLIFLIVRATLNILSARHALGGAVVSRWGGATPVSVGLASIWLVHPLQTEAVVWTIQRTELLVIFFLLLALAAALTGFASERHRGLWMALSIFFCALGMGSKEVMAAAPILVFLYDWMFISRSFREMVRRRWLFYAGLASTWLILAAVIISSPRGNTVGFDLGVSAIEYLRTQTLVIVHYLRLCFWPDPLAIAYDWPIAESWVPAIIPGLIVLALLALTIFGIGRRHPLGFAVAVFFLILAPSSSFVPIITEVAAERRMYLPLFSVILTVFALVDLALVRISKPRVRPLVGITVWLLIVALSLFVSAQRIDDYATEESIWRANHAVFPDRYQSNAGLGTALVHLELYQEAIPHLERAVELLPDDVFSRESLAISYAHAGRYDDAIEAYRQVLIRRPDTPKVHHNLGLIFFQLKRYEDAARSLEHANRLRPDSPATLASLAQVHSADPLSPVFDPERALYYAHRANEATGYAQPVLLEMLAQALVAAAQIDEAIQVIDQLLALDPPVPADMGGRLEALRKRAQERLDER